MAKPIIAVDADDTLFDENNAVRLFHNAKYGTAHTLEDYREQGEFYSFWEHIWNTDIPETDRRYLEFVEWKLANNLPPLPGALEALKHLKKSHDLVVITARNQAAVRITYDGLAEHFSELFSNVYFVPQLGEDKLVDKAKVCVDIGAAYLIDDGYMHCKLAVEAGVKALLFGNYGWNQHQELLPGMDRVKDWAAVKDYFDAK
jgi:FMN phosphatase YigB (HAD superfamily)